MFLKKIESVGFKSFAERISVDFVPGVTAVVGPNGSGKSNITDAIRWVLGEQSARSLRGTKMEDIIFQGSDSRKPLNVAEVTLVLDNQDQTLPIDYEEVSVTRRVYRSGESEFLLNKQTCRLKDIIDLFMDSGLGREAFSIISQGKVEEILSSKAEERRTIFEEAAGVLKYKNRKKKAEYKLAETQENLNRVEDIIYEIEGQLDPLKLQASVAKEYLDKKEILTGKEISLLIAEIEQLHRDWKEYLKTVEQQKNEEIEKTTTIQQNEASVEKERQDMQRLDQTIQELQDFLLELTQELENLQGNKKLIQERSRHYEQNKSQLSSNLETLQSKIDTSSDQYAKEESQLTQLIETRDSIQQKIHNIQEQLTDAEENIEDKIEELKAEYIDGLNKQAAKRNEKQSITQQLEQIELKQKNHMDKFDDQLTKRDKSTVELNELKTELDNYNIQIKEQQQQVQSIKADIQQSKTDYQASQDKLIQGYQYIEKLKSKQEMLTDMKEDFQGYFQGVKAVLKAREDGQLNGIHGAVLELIDIPKEYLVAMETALGAQSQHIVVNDEKCARQAIQWLKQSNNGRATFLPVQTMRPKVIPSSLLGQLSNHSGFVDVAANLIQYDQKHHAVIHNLLGNTIFAQTLKDANELAKLSGRRFRIVTLDGDVVNPGGSMSGGARKNNNQSLFTREKDLQEVSEKITKSHEQTLQFEQKVAEKKHRLESKEAALEEVRETIQTLQKHENDLQAQYTEKKVQLRHIHDNLGIYDQEKQQLDQEFHRLKQQKKAVQDKLDQMEQRLANAQHRIEELTNTKNEHQVNYQALQNNMHQLRIKLAEQDRNVHHQKEKVTNLMNSLEELKQSKKDTEKQLQELMAFQNSNRQQQEIEESVWKKEQEKQETTKKIQQYRQQRLEKTQAIEDAEREIKTMQNQKQAIVEKIQTNEVKANRLDVELENKINHLQTEYIITFEKARETYPKANDIEEAGREVKLLKRSIEELGTVNIGAIEEYERIEERYQFLTEQQADLNEAKDTLYTVIAEMDEEMQRRFEDTFMQIKEEFSYVFQQLFGGGHAALQLTDPNDLLETGVEIKAQPPGKKAQQLALLSGGERALTAIALLFAILRVRPVPFCVLDEVEAALDDANVQRFARYLQEYSNNTQFIVITHRKGTMEEADVLYGVTMQESGVSRLVSVKLEETNEMMNTTV
ncbi:Chromosome partition protein Smc [Paraliobacillus sp. PM-2]|uniref:chromosome segregation protein SMC n=1 Tax=Paraliobacillus sp. PM-2 TaxID=1462524 RepID=UPI00061C6D83|nr:chromosome segregation protein SMC [Paraliobacillus sp. PM-2]CQR47726.1 Chromosome partition protein Smc [Paraliobacillus sp. PM-2]